MDVNILNIIYTTLTISIPLILAALGGMISVRAGIMALGLEGMVLAGAFGAAVGSHFGGNPYWGIVGALLIGGFIGLMHGVLCVKFKVNQVISGIGLNLLTSAGTSMFLQRIWNSRGASGEVAQLPKVKIEAIKDIPVIGTIFASQSILFYTTIILVVVLWVVMYKTVVGLRLRMVGENPKAAATLGIDVNKYKYVSVVLCGMLAGLAGAFLSIDYLASFSREMSAGRGYIAVVITILGGYHPIGILLAGWMFGFAQAMQITLQGAGIPTQFVQMIPYVVTLIVLVFGVKYVVGPQGVGKNYDD